MVAIFAVTAEVVFCVCCQRKSPKHTSFTVCMSAVENEGIVSKLLLINQHVRATLKLLLESKCTSSGEALCTACSSSSTVVHATRVHELLAGVYRRLSAGLCNVPQGQLMLPPIAAKQLLFKIGIVECLHCCNCCTSLQ